MKWFTLGVLGAGCVAAVETQDVLGRDCNCADSMTGAGLPGSMDGLFSVADLCSSTRIPAPNIHSLKILDLAASFEAFARFYMISGLLNRYAVATTDGGHGDDLQLSSINAESWALSSPGNLNWHLLEDFTHVALHDMAEISKAIITSFYGSPPHHSYFHGSSTGGRQGIMPFILMDYWPHFVMNQLGVYPKPCKLDAISAESIKACGELDGVADGYILLPGACDSHPHVLVGKSFECDGSPATFTKPAAHVAEAAWSGPRSADGKWQWIGIAKDAKLVNDGIGVATTPAVMAPYSPYPSRGSFISRRKTPGSTSPRLHMTIGMHYSTTGGKMITWHGIRDAVIPVNGTVHYYDRVLAEDSNSQDYYRFFLASGADHSLYTALTPQNMMDVIVDWVEQRNASETLGAVGADGAGTAVERDLCLYPRVQVYDSGDPSLASSFKCAE
ncbi:hypothetical protein FE257_008641 [Aspergillus nanangensis]|uniref:Carboxylic ester hydrolase n=1 Tax=Aspergillus nanangensis TaxID=2582783 RepID=A0AAD4CL41_ASPNN|nr:hypothetical protein FE257_008641 [Aspergillus nanangensis]